MWIHNLYFLSHVYKKSVLGKENCNDLIWADFLDIILSNCIPQPNNGTHESHADRVAKWAKWVLLKKKVKTWAKNLFLKGPKFGSGKRSCCKLVWGGPVVTLVWLSWYQTSFGLVQGLAELLCSGIAAVSVPRLPESPCVKGLLRIWQRSTAHTDSTLLLTGCTARWRSKHTCIHWQG